MDINVHISNPDYFFDLLNYGQISGIYIEQERTTPERLRRFVKAAHEAGKMLYVALPFVWNTSAGKTLDRQISAIIGAFPDGYLIRNIDELGLLSDRNASGKKILDEGMYTWNHFAMTELSALGADIFTAPYELSLKELEDRWLSYTEIVAYGNYPLMVSNNCLRKTTGKCVKEKDEYGIYRLKDRKNASFPVVNCCRYCYNIIYNSVPTWLLDEEGIQRAPYIRLSFTTESRLEMKNILDRYFAGDTAPRVSMTRGHFRKGAE